MREIAEELGVAGRLSSAILDCWVYEVLPQREVLIVTYGVRRADERPMRVSDEHRRFGLVCARRIGRLADAGRLSPLDPRLGGAMRYPVMDAIRVTPMAAPALDRLLAIMARLRDPERGCPWDREQDFATIAPYTIEEAYEVADAIARGDMAALKDELGDLLFQVVFHARMAEEAGLFDFADVAAAIADKMVRRHPHVFGDAEIASAAAQTEAWEEHKAKERAGPRRGGRGPGERARRRGARPPCPAPRRQDPAARGADRLRLAGGAPGHRQDRRGDRRARSRARRRTRRRRSLARIEDEMGDILFAAANLARKLDIDPEAALRRATAKFERRFRALEALAAERGAGADLDALEALWQEVKRGEE